MRIVWILLLGVAAGLIWPVSAKAQAFGLAQGTPISRLDVERDLGDGRYRVNVPSPNSEFEGYVATATSQHGVCKVSGLGKTLSADRDGSQARQTFRRLRQVLIERYGQPSDDFDFIKAGALWDGTSEWAASIKQNERVLASYWNSEGGISIGLTANALDFTDTYLILTYEYPNYEDCLAIKAAVDNKGL